MDYVVGSVAALITGNVTPHRPTRLNKIALTPTKHQPSPNVTPKSEFVDDRSIFLSPSMQKKKAIVKKSPKRIFENPDLDVTENGEGNPSLSSPKADKVKKHLKDDLEGGAATVPKSPKSKGKKRESTAQEENNENVIDQVSNQNTPKKKKKKQASESDQAEAATQPTEIVTSEVTVPITKSPKKNKQRRKSVAEPDSNKENDNTEQVIEPQTTNSPKKQNNKELKPETAEKTSETTESNTNTPKKKNRKRKKKSKAQTAPDSSENKEVEKTDTSEAATEEKVKETSENEPKKSKKKNKKKKSKAQKTVEEKMEVDGEKPEESDNEEESNPTVNPNAITDKDSDSEHDSDDDIDSENEEINKKVLEAEKQDSSDEEDEEEKPQKGEKKKVEKVNAEESGVERSTEDEIKRTLFVGNVPFSAKVKKEVKKIFSKHGQIETIRIRTVPIKDGRYTPKLALIKHELHPERTTVNVYIKYASEESVEKALVENNTVLNDHHLRVSRSSSTGAEHDPKCSIFIGNLPFAMEDEALRAKFEKCGEIQSVRIVRDKKTNAGKGFGYVNFESKDGVELALALTEEDLTVKNRILRVKRCTQVTNKKKPVQTGNNQSNQPQRGFRGNQGQQRGNFRPDNQRNGPPARFNQGNRQNGPPSRNNQGNRQNGPPSRNNQGNRQRNARGNNNQQGGFNKFGGQRNQAQSEEGHDGAHRRIMNKRKSQEGAGGEGPPNKRPRDQSQPNKEKKPRKEFVGMTAEKKKKRKFDKGQKKKKALSEILTK
uniref:SFRICE_020808 n=1 Tax=Spodoptera frugiperda TaxID=7108 RepID=A0A2H1WYZ8_SPOFR